MAGDGARPAVRAKAADARPGHPCTRQARHAAHHVHRAGTDGVVHACSGQQVSLKLVYILYFPYAESCGPPYMQAGCLPE